MSYSKPGDVKFDAAWTPEENEVTVVMSRWAGISGPHGSYPATSREDAARVLFDKGYLVTGPWDVAMSGDHWTPIVSMG